MEPQERPEHQDLKVRMGLTGSGAFRGLRGLRGTRDHQDHRESKQTSRYTESPETSDSPDPQGPPEIKETGAPRGLWAQTAGTVNLDSLDPKVCLETPVSMESPVLLALADPTGTTEKWEGQAVKGKKVFKDPVVKMVRTENQD